MTGQAPQWLDPVMRAGFGARAAVYAIVGGLAVAAAWRGGGAEGTRGALSRIAQEPWGEALLLLIGIGLFAYALWRALDGLMDLESYGADAKGAVARVGMLVTGAVHVALGVYCVSLAFGDASGGGGGRTQGWTAQLLAQDYGRWLVGAIGLCVVGAGVYYWVKAFTEKYKRNIRSTATTETLDPAMKAGLVAHGAVVAIVGGFFIWAAWTHDASEAGGLGKAFDEIRAAPSGQLLLAAVAAGLVGFALFCLVQAVYGVVPRAAGLDVMTLGGRTVGDVTGRAKRVARRAAG